jgi:dTDP-4-dehydrorhamnose 3,5-epimerase-like enzyme
MQLAGREIVCLRRVADERGALIIAEAGQQLPFAAQRAYLIAGTPPGVTRGHHAHRQLQQFAVATCGGVTLHMDDGRARWQVRLERPSDGLLIPPMVWHEMTEFTNDCVLLVLASDRYREQDYIRSREEFVGAVT